MIVVSDTSPLTALLHVGQADLLRLLFDRVLIPPAVRHELLRDHALLPEWVEVLPPRKIPLGIAAAHLDLGETEALALALELKANLVLMDERLGRRVAVSLGLTPTGLLGCLIMAKRSGHITQLAPLIDELRIQAGCWFDRPLIAAVLAAVGEAPQVE